MTAPMPPISPQLLATWPSEFHAAMTKRAHEAWLLLHTQWQLSDMGYVPLFDDDGKCAAWERDLSADGHDLQLNFTSTEFGEVCIHVEHLPTGLLMRLHEDDLTVRVIHDQPVRSPLGYAVVYANGGVWTLS